MVKVLTRVRPPCTTNEIKAEAAERDSREALRHETLSGMLEMEVKRVATAQEEQEIRFTTQLAEIRSSTFSALVSTMIPSGTLDYTFSSKNTERHHPVCDLRPAFKFENAIPWKVVSETLSKSYKGI